MMNVHECSLRNAEPNNSVSLVSSFTLPPIYNKPLLHTSRWCRRLGISSITESFLWPTGFQPDHWQNQRCPAGPDVTRKLASKKCISLMEIDGNIICWQVLGKKLGHHKGPMNYSFEVWCDVWWQLIMDYFVAFFPSHHVGSSRGGPPGPQEYDSKLASAAKALGQLKRSLGRYWNEAVESGWDERSLGITVDVCYILFMFYWDIFIYIYIHHNGHEVLDLPNGWVSVVSWW